MTTGAIRLAEAKTMLRKLADKDVSTIDSLATVLAMGLEAADQIRELKRRLAELETKRTMAFEGSHDPARAYPAGAVVQRSGAVWVALVPTSETPGASTNWRRILGDAR